jgi:hypothetical protein
MKTIIDGDQKTYQFESIEEQIRHALATVKKIRPSGNLPTEGFFKDKKALMRSDINTWDDLEKALARPWVEGIEIIKKLREQIPEQETDFSSSRRRRRSTSEVDGDVDFDRWMAGRSDFFDLPMSIKVKGGSKFVSLAFASGMSHAVSGASAFVQAASIVAAVDKLEEQGVQVELSSYNAGRQAYKSGPRDRLSVIVLKRAGEPVNIESLATAVSPWFFRLVGLTSQCADALEFPIDRGLGFPNYDFSKVKRFMPVDTQEIVRCFDLNGAIQTYLNVSSMIKKEGDADYGSSSCN